MLGAGLINPREVGRLAAQLIEISLEIVEMRGSAADTEAKHRVFSADRFVVY